MPSYPTIVLGDLHGSYELAVQALSELGLVDAAGRWTGGSRRLVQVGDLIDRGPRPLDTLDLFMRLQEEARAAGGEVTCLLGNHELMALRAALGEHEWRISWAMNGAGANLTQWAARRSATVDPTALPYPEEFLAEFSPAGRYGCWLHSLPVAARVGEYVAVHAGWPPDGPDSVDEANALLAHCAADERLHGLVWARRQPQAELEAACSRLNCRGLITGHSVQTGVRASAGGRLIQIDVGIWYQSTWAALGLDEAGAPWALVPGRAPQLLAADGLAEVPQREAEGGSPPTPRFRPGELVRIYRAPDGAYSQYLLVEGQSEMFGAPTYTGRAFIWAQGGWTVRPASPTCFCERIDRFGRPAPLSEVPAEIAGTA